MNRRKTTIGLIGLIGLIGMVTFAAKAAETPVVRNVLETGPDALRVTGPTDGLVGQEVSLVVRGLPEVDAQQTLAELLSVFENLRLSVSSPGEPVDIDSEVTFTVAPVAYRMRLEFTPQEAGTHVIAVDWNEPPFGLALHRIEIRGPPEPDDPTDPTNPPLTTNPTAAVYVYEKDQGSVPGPVSQALHRLNTERDSFAASAIDQDIVTGGGTVPAQFQAAIAAARAAGLPALVILGESGVLRVLPNPTTEAEIMEAVQ